MERRHHRPEEQRSSELRGTGQEDWSHLQTNRRWRAFSFLAPTKVGKRVGNLPQRGSGISRLGATVIRKCSKASANMRGLEFRNSAVNDSQKLKQKRAQIGCRDNHQIPLRAGQAYAANGFSGWTLHFRIFERMMVTKSAANSGSLRKPIEHRGIPQPSMMRSRDRVAPTVLFFTSIS